MTAIVLAGGAATRFGGDKLAARLDGRPLLEHALRAVAGVADDVVVVLAPDGPDPVLPSDLAPRVRFARDPEPRRGPLAGLVAGLALAPDEPASVALVAGGDMPLMDVGVLRLLVESLAAADGVAAMSLEARLVSPLPLAIRTWTARPAAAGALAAGRRSLRALLDAVPSAVLPAGRWRRLDPEGRTLRDVDTAADLDGA